jgi:hypothetical protein
LSLVNPAWRSLSGARPLARFDAIDHRGDIEMGGFKAGDRLARVLGFSHDGKVFFLIDPLSDAFVPEPCTL